MAISKPIRNEGDKIPLKYALISATSNMSMRVKNYGW